jgi:ribonuclease E
MVLESNRDLVLRRLVECLGRDRTRHQVAEVTSLGLVQMTRKRIGTGLLEAFSETASTARAAACVIHDTRRAEHRRRRRQARRRGRWPHAAGAQRRQPTAATAPRSHRHPRTSPRWLASTPTGTRSRSPTRHRPSLSRQELQPEPDLGKESADTP